MPTFSPQERNIAGLRQTMPALSLIFTRRSSLFLGLCLVCLCSCNGDWLAARLSNAGEAAVGSGIGPYTVGAYYYPWHGGDFHGGRYLRERLSPAQTPVLGEYDDRRFETLAQHLAWSRQANVSLWVTSWWGPDRREDLTLRQHVLTHPDLGDHKIALFYETQGRTRGFEQLDAIGTDIEHLAQHYFDHPNYLHIDGRPVLFVYLTRVLSRRGTLAAAVDSMRQAAERGGHRLYIVGDQVFGQPPASSEAMALLDAVTNYDVYGSMGGTGYAGQEAVDAYYRAQAGWRDRAADAGVAFVPAVTPGFNDRGVRQGHGPVSRRLTPNAEFGSLFRAMLRGGRELTDASTGNLLMVTSWNEWHEDTQIEPVTPAAATADDDSDSEAYTEGLEYEGYGERYLDILRQETARR
jgi:glycoprotein endo-alpha-1,2-mannosidase